MGDRYLPLSPFLFWEIDRWPEVLPQPPIRQGSPPVNTRKINWKVFFWTGTFTFFSWNIFEQSFSWCYRLGRSSLVGQNTPPTHPLSILLPPALSEPTHHRFRDPLSQWFFRCSTATVFLSKASTPLFLKGFWKKNSLEMTLFDCCLTHQRWVHTYLPNGSILSR